MKLIEILYKVVKSPKSSQNYIELKEYFDQNNMPEMAEAFAHLIKVKYAANNCDTHKQE